MPLPQAHRAAIASAALTLFTLGLTLDASAKSGPSVSDHRTHRAQVYSPWKPNTQGPANRPPSPPKGPVVRDHK
jgi:hypothetical protein